MMKDASKTKKNGTVSVLKPPTAKKPVDRAMTRKVSVKAILSLAQEHAVKRREANRKALIRAAVVFFILFLILVVWFGSRPRTVPDNAPVRKGVTETAVSPAQTETLGFADKKSEEEGIKKESDKATRIDPIIAAVHINPSQPLSTDRIEAAAVLAGGDVEGISFSYHWKINDQFISAQGTDTLTDLTLNRGDRISVVVTAAKGEIAGPQTESPTVVIHSLPPSLDMKIVTDRFRPGDTVEIQLIGRAPDNDKIVYSLESPFLEGMALNENTGRITWKPERLLPGKLQFGASCSDTDGNKTVKIFALDFGVSSPK